MAESRNTYIDDLGSTVLRRSVIAFADIPGHQERIPEAAERTAKQEPLSEVRRYMTRPYIGLRTCAIAAVAFLGVAACSVTDYKQPIGDMAGALDQSLATIEEIDRRITAVYDADWRKDLAEKPVTVKLRTVTKTCRLKSDGCRLEIRRSGKSDHKQFPPTSVIPNSKLALAGLRAYVTNLGLIVDADTVNAVTASANAALGSLQNIERNIKAAVAKPDDGKPGDEKPGPVATFGAPTVSAINWLIGQYVDYVKVRALKKATKTAQPVVVKLANYFDAVSELQAIYELTKVADAFEAAKQAYDAVTPPDSRSIDQYVSAARNYDRALRAASVHPLRDFAKAHAKLEDQLNGNTSLSEAFAAIENLVERAKAFEAIIDEFDQASSNQ